MIYVLDAAVTVTRIGACCNFARAGELVYTVRQLGAELEAVVGERNNGESPGCDILVDQNVGDALGREIGCGNGVHPSVRRPKTLVERRM